MLVACGLLLVAATGLLGWVASDWLVGRFTGFDLRRTPGIAPAYPAPALPPPRWRRYATSRMTVVVPPYVTRRQPVASAPGALVLTNRRQTLWCSFAVMPRGTRWTSWWYRTCLYAQRNPIGLIGKALLVPPLGTAAPRLQEQQLGPWRGFLYMDAARRRLVADLFDARSHVTAVFVARHDGLLDMDAARTMLALIRVTGGAA